MELDNHLKTYSLAVAKGSWVSTYSGKLLEHLLGGLPQQYAAETTGNHFSKWPPNESNTDYYFKDNVHTEPHFTMCVVTY